MQLTSYQFTCRFYSQAVLPAFKGSTIRGGLGHALKRIACALRQQECHNCLLHQTCAYSFLFEGKKNPHSSATDKIRRVAPPHPYILLPPEENKRSYEPGSSFAFGITLLGPAIQFLPHLVFAVQEMGKTGLGKKTQGNSGQFHLEAVYRNNIKIYAGQSLDTSIAPDELALTARPSEKIRHIALTCNTPLRLKQDNEFQDKLPFQLLIRAALRRISSLESAYGYGEPDLDYKGLVDRASRVAITQSSLRWTDIERYSNRQKGAMLMGGIKGSTTYQGDELSEFVPLLRYCERVHLGKETSFGLGRISISTEES